jgi:MFS transporter, FHS family, L-fucose permease
VKNRPLITLISVFFFWGFVAASNTILIGLFKKNFELSQSQSQLVDSAFYAAYGFGSLLYFIISFYSGDPLNKIGYKKGLIIGLAISALGALGFIPAAMQHSFPLMLSALFTIAIGFTLQQIVANPYVIRLGDPATGAHRNSLAGGVNSFGTTIGPLLLAMAVYGSISGTTNYLIRNNEKAEISVTVERTSGKSENITAPVYIYNDSMSIPANVYIVGVPFDKTNEVYGQLIQRNTGGILFLMNDSIAQAAIQNLKTSFPEKQIPILSTSLSNGQKILNATVPNIPVSLELKYYGVDAVILPSIILAVAFILFAFILGLSTLPSITENEKMSRDFGALKYPQVWLGMLAIFVYVGTEVTIQSNLPEYMRQLFSKESGATVHFISLYWGSLMIGRWVGALSVFNLKKQTKTILTVFVPLLAYAVILLVNYLKGSPMADLFKYIPFILIAIGGFFLAGEKPARTMLLFGLMAAVMIGIGIVIKNEWTTYFFLSGGLFCSVMWPCIFSLTITGLGKYTTQASSLLVMMIFGGAVFPFVQGAMADSGLGIHSSYLLPLAGFIYLAFFGWKISSILKTRGMDDNKPAESTGH